MVHQVFAVLFQTTQDTTPPPTAIKKNNTGHQIEGRPPKRRKMEKLSLYDPNSPSKARKPEPLIAQNAGTASIVENQYDQS